VAARADSRVGKGAQSLPVAGNTEEAELTVKGWVLEPSGRKQAEVRATTRRNNSLCIVYSMAEDSEL